MGVPFCLIWTWKTWGASFSFFFLRCLLKTKATRDEVINNTKKIQYAPPQEILTKKHIEDEVFQAILVVQGSWEEMGMKFDADHHTWGWLYSFWVMPCVCSTSLAFQFVSTRTLRSRETVDTEELIKWGLCFARYSRSVLSAADLRVCRCFACQTVSFRFQI